MAEALRGNDETVLKELWKDVFQNNKHTIFSSMNYELKLNLNIETVSDLSSSKIVEILNEIIIVR